MASFPAVTMTTEGLNMIAKASSGNIEDRLIITKVKFGDGVSEGNIREYTDVISPKMEVTLAEWEDRGDGRFRYTFTYNNKGVKTGFYHREIGLFAKSGDNGGEKLIAYSNAGSYPGYIDDETKEIPYQRLMINIGVGDTDNVTGQVDVSNAVTIEILDEHNADENAHAKLIKKLFGSSEATLESVKEKVNDWAKEVCLPLSGGELTGDITANNVYANNNVLVFNNVAEMKANNKVKIGYTLRTLGFYTAGDGGGADYIVQEADLYKVDEASTIALQNNLYARLIIKDVVNVKQFGAYGDGEHDDTKALKKIFLTDVHFFDSITVYFPDGNYLISETLETSSTYPRNIKMEQNARIFTETEDLEFLIRLGRWGSTAWDGWFIGGILDCNNKGKSCFGASAYGKGVGFVIRDVVCKNFKLYGLHTNPNQIPCTGFKAYNINFLNDTPWVGSICVYNLNTDNFFKDLYAVNVQGGIETQDKITVDNFHSWINHNCINELWENSFLIKVKAANGSGGCKFSKCFADTLRYGWVGVYVGNSMIPRITTVDCQYLINGDVVGTELMTQYPPSVFDLQDFTVVRDFGSTFTIPTNINGARIINSSNNKYDLQGCNFYGTSYTAPITELANLIMAPINGKITGGAVPRNLKSGRYHVKAGVTDVPEAGKEYLLEVIACGSFNDSYSDNIYSVQRFTVLSTTAPNVYQRIVMGTLDNANNVSNWVKLNS